MQTEAFAPERVPVVTIAPSNPEATRIAVAWINGILDDLKITGSKLALMSGLATSTVLRIVNDPDHRFTPSLKTMQAISTATHKPIPDDFFRAQNIGSSMVSRIAEEERAARNGRLTTMARSQEDSPAAKALAAPVERRQLTVHFVSNLPKSLQPAVFRGSRVDCPPQMDNDPTAFAFYQPDASLAPAIPGGTLMYATKKRDPQIGDIVLITVEDGRSRVRIVKDVSADGLEVAKGGSFDDTETIVFEDIEEIAVITGTWRA